jgi:hypothetical protein
MIASIKLWWLKRKFRAAYLHYRDTRPEYGLAMAGMMRPGIYMAAREANRIAEQLKELDPGFPKSWKPLPEGE